MDSEGEQGGITCHERYPFPSLSSFNDDTYHFINAESLEKMKDTAILVNTGRGPLVDEEAVAAALHDGSLGAYCADVMAQEPPSKDNPLSGRA